VTAGNQVLLPFGRLGVEQKYSTR